jgi:hypothetical protein
MSNTEVIIMSVFLVFMVVGIPTLLFLIERDKKRQEQEEWKRKSK